MPASARWSAASNLGMTVYELGEGQSICPYHYEYPEEEWLIVLEGRPTLRDPEGETVLDPGDVVCFPTGPEGAHKVTNRTPERVLVAMLSTKAKTAVAVYPDSDKVGVWSGDGDVATALPSLSRRRLLPRRALTCPFRPRLGTVPSRGLSQPRPGRSPVRRRPRRHVLAATSGDCPRRGSFGHGRGQSPDAARRDDDVRGLAGLASGYRSPAAIRASAVRRFPRHGSWCQPLLDLPRRRRPAAVRAARCSD